MAVIGTPYSDAVNLSRSGQAKGTGSAIALFLTEFGGMVITAYNEVLDYDDMRFIKRIQHGKSDTFPIIGRKRDAAEHTPGSLILGGQVLHDVVEISVDQIVFDSIFVPEMDELLNHYEVRAPYAQQLGQSLGSLQSIRIARMHILASRMYDSVPVPQGQPTPAYYAAADAKTNPSTMESACYAADVYMKQNEMMAAPLRRFMLPHQQFSLLARNYGVTAFKAEAGSGDRRDISMGPIASIQPKGTNHIPSTLVNTGLAKYQGDFSMTVGHIGSPMAVGSLERMGVRMTVKEQEERLGTLMIASQLNGHGALRGECSIEYRTTVKTGANSINLAA